MTKSEIREKVKELCRTHTDCEKISEKISNTIIRSKEFDNADVIFAYMALFDEVNVSLVIQKAFERGKKVCIPKVVPHSNKMDFYYLKKGLCHTEKTGIDRQTEIGAFGIKEPKAELKKALASDFVHSTVLVLVPGRAFSADGSRIGRGKGYYDLFLSDFTAKNVILAGVCFPFQVFTEIPNESYDIKMHRLFCAV